ncbi:MAG: hypothetical protein JKX73_07135 [Flavobacteriales bacterium]|nr:hypothetical protein [Flavobacteriales bacterium]
MKTVKSYKILLAASALVLLGMSFTGCKVFKKNKCLECPKWSKYDVQEATPDSKKA